MVSHQLLDVFCCPRCRARLSPTQGENGCACIQCGSEYLEREGILDLHPEPTEAARSEMAGHQVLESQWIDAVPEALRTLVLGEAGEELLLSLPMLPRSDLAQIPSLARMDALADDFFELLDWMNPQPGECILELGAHMGWASHHLAKRGAYVIASDISHQLALTEAFIKRGVPMERVHADMMDLPVHEGVVDTIFGVSVIHHADDLTRLFRVCAHGLKPGGRCVFFSEPVAGLYGDSQKEEFGASEIAVGIQEHIYTIVEYFSAATDAGLLPAVLPLHAVLRDTTRRYRGLRALWRGLLKRGIGYHPLFMRHIYPFMLRFYPTVPFPHMALVFTKPRQNV